MLYGFSVSMVGAALRLGMLQHFDGQRIIHELKPIMSETVEKNIDRPLSSMWQFATGYRYTPNGTRKNVVKNVYYLIGRIFSFINCKRIPRLGIGGPVGSGKTMLIEQVVPRL